MADRCIVSGCENRIGEGSFVGSLCRPCHDMLVSGDVGIGSTFIHRLGARVHELERDLLERDRGSDRVPVDDSEICS